MRYLRHTREDNQKKTDSNWPKTPQELASLPIPVKDICWVFLRPGFIFDSTTLGHIACDMAGSVLHIYEDRYPNYNRARNAIATKRQWLDGLIGDKELYDAAAYDAAVYAVYAAYAAYGAAYAAAAYGAAYDAAVYAAYAAAVYAAYGAYDAAYDAAAYDAVAYAAAYDAQWGKNLEIIKGYIG